MWYADSSSDRPSTFRNTEDTADSVQRLEDDIIVIPKSLCSSGQQHVSRKMILFIVKVGERRERQRSKGLNSVHVTKLENKVTAVYRENKQPMLWTGGTWGQRKRLKARKQEVVIRASTVKRVKFP